MLRSVVVRALTIAFSFGLVGISCGGVSTRSSGDDANGGDPSTGGGTGAAPSGGAPASGGSGATSAGGAAGTTGTGGADPIPSTPGICTSNADCTLSVDCCSCFAAGPGEATAICRNVCTPETNACAREGTTAEDVVCFAGRCVLNRNCHLFGVTCEREAPDCPTGTVPSRLGDCYGPCTSVSECYGVPSCDVCESAGLSCVVLETATGPYPTCASTPPACEGNPTCACMGVCQNEYSCANLDGTELKCECFSC